MTQQVFEGLEGILVTRTEISSVQGEAGTLSVRGCPIESLVGSMSFEGMVGLLGDGCMPDAPRSAAIARELGAARVAAFDHLAPRWTALHGGDAMTTLRSALSSLPTDAGPLGVVAAAAVASAAWIRRARGEPLLAPKPGLRHAADLLRMLRGDDASEGEGDLLDAYWVTVAEHGLNASTFAARVVASTGADLTGAVVAGVAALAGPLHGGAPGPVLDMLDAVMDATRAGTFVRAELDAGRRIMGMGHRVYRVRDPRAFVLERALRAHQPSAKTSARLALARAVEGAAEAELSRRYPARALRANVEFYTALLLEALGVPRAAFTAIFACARVAGYAAHYAEQRRTGRLIRPAALYVGRQSSAEPRS